MKSRVDLWRFLLFTPRWEAPACRDHQPLRISIKKGLVVEVPEVVSLNIRSEHYLRVELADGEIEWARVQMRRPRDTGTVALFLEPL